MFKVHPDADWCDGLSSKLDICDEHSEYDKDDPQHGWHELRTPPMPSLPFSDCPTSIVEAPADSWRQPGGWWLWCHVEGQPSFRQVAGSCVRHSHGSATLPGSDFQQFRNESLEGEFCFPEMLDWTGASHSRKWHDRALSIGYWFWSISWKAYWFLFFFNKIYWFHPFFFQ